MLKPSASGVLASFRPSTGTRPPHHSAARTDLVLLIRRTVRPRGYASTLHSLRSCWTASLSILRDCFPLLRTLLTRTGVIVKPLVNYLAVLPLGNDNLLHVNRLAIGGDEVEVAFVEAHVVTDA